MSRFRFTSVAVAAALLALGCAGDAPPTESGSGESAFEQRASDEGAPDLARLDEAVGPRSVEGVDLFVRTFGVGDPLLVVHGGPGMEHSYLVPGLDIIQNDSRLVFYDQRGTGRSGGEVVPNEVTLDAFLRDIDGVRASIGVEKIDVLAHSFGGLLGLLYAARFPERVQSLTLVNSSEPGSRFADETTARQSARLKPQDTAELDRLTRTEEFARRDSVAMNRMYWLALRRTFADPARADRLRIEFTKRTADNGGPVASFLVGPLGEYDFWSEVEEIAAPTLVVHGVEDLLPQSVAEALANSIVGAELALIPDAGHFPFLERPELFREAVASFLDRVRSP